MARTPRNPSRRRSERSVVQARTAATTDEVQRQQTSPRGIRLWNNQVNERYGKARDTKIVTAVLYPVYSGRPRPIRLPCFNNPGDDPRATGLVDDVRVSPWFPNGMKYNRIHQVPGTSLVLANDYTVITTRRPHLGPPNQSAAAALGSQANGNIIVLRHHHRYRMSVTNVHSSERKMIDYVVRQYARVRIAVTAYPLTEIDRFLKDPRGSRRSTSS